MEHLLVISGLIVLAFLVYLVLGDKPYEIARNLDADSPSDIGSFLHVAVSVGVFFVSVFLIAWGVSTMEINNKPAIQKPSPEICLEEVQRNFPEVDVYTIEKKMIGESWFLYSKHGIYHITTTNEGNCDINYTKLMYKQAGGFRKIDTVYIDTLKITDTIVDQFEFDIFSSSLIMSADITSSR